jgi:hypothetical protein
MATAEKPPEEELILPSNSVENYNNVKLLCI